MGGRKKGKEAAPAAVSVDSPTSSDSPKGDSGIVDYGSNKSRSRGAQTDDDSSADTGDSEPEDRSRGADKSSDESYEYYYSSSSEGEKLKKAEGAKAREAERKGQTAVAKTKQKEPKQNETAKAKKSTAVADEEKSAAAKQRSKKAAPEKSNSDNKAATKKEKNKGDEDKRKQPLRSPTEPPAVAEKDKRRKPLRSPTKPPAVAAPTKSKAAPAAQKEAKHALATTKPIKSKDKGAAKESGKKMTEKDEGKTRKRRDDREPQDERGREKERRHDRWCREDKNRSSPEVDQKQKLLEPKSKKAPRPHPKGVDKETALDFSAERRRNYGKVETDKKPPEATAVAADGTAVAAEASAHSAEASAVAAEASPAQVQIGVVLQEAKARLLPNRGRTNVRKSKSETSADTESQHNEDGQRDHQSDAEQAQRRAARSRSRSPSAVAAKEGGRAVLQPNRGLPKILPKEKHTPESRTDINLIVGQFVVSPQVKADDLQSALDNTPIALLFLILMPQSRVGESGVVWVDGKEQAQSSVEVVKSSTRWQSVWVGVDDTCALLHRRDRVESVAVVAHMDCETCTLAIAKVMLADNEMNVPASFKVSVIYPKMPQLRDSSAEQNDVASGTLVPLETSFLAAMKRTIVDGNCRILAGLFCFPKDQIEDLARSCGASSAYPFCQVFQGAAAADDWMFHPAFVIVFGKCAKCTFPDLQKEDPPPLPEWLRAFDAGWMPAMSPWVYKDTPELFHTWSSRSRGDKDNNRNRGDKDKSNDYGLSDIDRSGGEVQLCDDQRDLRQVKQKHFVDEWWVEHVHQLILWVGQARQGKSALKRWRGKRGY